MAGGFPHVCDLDGDRGVRGGICRGDESLEFSLYKGLTKSIVSYSPLSNLLLSGNKFPTVSDETSRTTGEEKERVSRNTQRQRERETESLGCACVREREQPRGAGADQQRQCRGKGQGKGRFRGMGLENMGREQDFSSEIFSLLATIFSWKTWRPHHCIRADPDFGTSGTSGSLPSLPLYRFPEKIPPPLPRRLTPPAPSSSSGSVYV